MLDIHDVRPRYSRRQLLSVGSLALGGLSLSSLLAARSHAAGTSGLVTGKSVIFVFQQGGPSQFETFDPKPAAPNEIRTQTELLDTSIPGVQFAAPMERLARLADKLAIVRSFQTGNAEHNIRPIVGPESLNANIGSLVSRVVGPTHPTTSIPTNAILFPQAVCNDVPKGQGRGDMTATGTLGGCYAPFVPGSGGQLVNNLQLSLPVERFNRRQELSARLDRLQGELDNDPQLHDFDHYQQQAAELLLSGRMADALDLSKEDPAVVARYDTGHFVPEGGWTGSARGRRGLYTGHARSIGKLLLLARRLCEAGCGFVTVHGCYEGVWDMHADAENLNIRHGMEAVGRAFDHALAALIADLAERGLADQVLVVATGEMGRTPRINKNGGRDHWARLAPLLLSGGGVAGGQVIGSSTRDGGEPASEPWTTRNLISTILHTVFDVGQLRLAPALAPIARLAEAAPIAGTG